MSSYQRLRERYEAGQAPWDDPLPPPEIMAEAEKLPPGRALDLGCGYGRAAIYLAQRQWRVDGVDFIDLALAEAARRAEKAGVSGRVQFHLSPVTDLDFLVPPYDLVLDVGCLHNFDEATLSAYRNEVFRLLRPGGLYLLFAHLRADPPEYDDQGAPRWIPEPLIHTYFGEGFTLEKVKHGTTQVEDRPPRPSAWFWFGRT